MPPLFRSLSRGVVCQFVSLFLLPPSDRGGDNRDSTYLFVPCCAKLGYKIERTVGFFHRVVPALPVRIISVPLASAVYRKEMLRGLLRVDGESARSIVCDHDLS